MASLRFRCSVESNDLLHVLTEKKAQCKSSEFHFIWGPTKNYSPGDSLSDSSKGLLQRSRGRAKIYMIFFFFGLEIPVVKLEKITASDGEQVSQ